MDRNRFDAWLRVSAAARTRRETARLLATGLGMGVGFVAGLDSSHDVMARKGRKKQRNCKRRQRRCEREAQGNCQLCRASAPPPPPEWTGTPEEWVEEYCFFFCLDFCSFIWCL